MSPAGDQDVGERLKGSSCVAGLGLDSSLTPGPCSPLRAGGGPRVVTGCQEDSGEKEGVEQR